MPEVGKIPSSPDLSGSGNLLLELIKRALSGPINQPGMSLQPPTMAPLSPPPAPVLPPAIMTPGQVMGGPGAPMGPVFPGVPPSWPDPRHVGQLPSFPDLTATHPSMTQQQPAGPRAPDASSPFSLPSFLDIAGGGAGAQPDPTAVYDPAGGAPVGGYIGSGGDPLKALSGIFRFMTGQMPRPFDTPTPGQTQTAPATGPQVPPWGSAGFGLKPWPGTTAGAGAGGGTSLGEVPGSPYPGPPEPTQPPPSMGPAVGTDYSAARRALAEGAPRAPDLEAHRSATFANVLAGLAGGAGQVDPTSAGSFARALALGGAGAGKARGEGTMEEERAQERYGERKTKFALERSELETKAAMDKANVANAQRQIDWGNAKTQVDWLNAEAEAQRKYKMDMYGAEKPTTHVLSDGSVVNVYRDPKTGTTKQEFHQAPRDVNTELAQSIKIAQGLGIDPTTLTIDTISRFVREGRLDPEVGQTMIHHAQMEHVIRSNYGAATFGDDYKKAEKEVIAEMKAESDQITKAGGMVPEKAEDIRPIREKRIADRLYFNLWNSGRRDWIPKMGFSGAPGVGGAAIAGVAPQPVPFQQFLGYGPSNGFPGQ